MIRRTLALAAIPLVALPLLAGACSSDDDSKAPSTTATSEVGNVLPPVVLTPEQTSTTVKPGTTVTFDMGEPGEGSFVATSSDPAVFEVTSEGKVEGTFTTNAGGVAKAKGTAEVTVQFKGSTNGLGTPTTFTVTVE
jgi:hypothetical protein